MSRAKRGTSLLSLKLPKILGDKAAILIIKIDLSESPPTAGFHLNRFL